MSILVTSCTFHRITKRTGRTTLCFARYHYKLSKKIKHKPGNDEDELFLWYGLPMKGVLVLFPDNTTVRDPHHRESPIYREEQDLSAEPEFRLCWMKLCNSGNHYTTALQRWRYHLDTEKNSLIFNLEIHTLSIHVL